MPCRADALLLGVLCAILFRNNRVWEWVNTHTRLLQCLLLLLILGIIGLTVGNTPNATSISILRGGIHVDGAVLYMHSLVSPK